MRIYYFAPETGVYQGEDFWEESQAVHADGITTVAPPPYNRGELPLFDAATHQWSLTPLTNQHLIHRNHS